MNDNDRRPFVSASANVPEVTTQSVLLGVVLAVILGAANAYLGLYAGMTVSASIPAAVLSMGILRGLFRRGTILENNIVQTIASSGEALAAGVIFTIPALLIAGVWEDILFWPTTLIAICGGLLGIVFMIPLRRQHIVEDRTLTFPEGVACATVLKAGEEGGRGAIYVLLSMLLGAVFKFFVSGVSLIKGTSEWAWSAGKTAFFFGSDISPALVGVGYIVGFNISFVMFLGGAITWCLAIPLFGGLNPIEGDLLTWFWNVWSSHGRYIGVGAMVVGGLWSIVGVRKAIVQGLKEAIHGYRDESGERIVPVRTEENMAQSHLILILVLTVLATFFLYQYLIQSLAVTLVATISMVIMSFFFVAVGSYICGLVGSSNSPISGMTICAVLAVGQLLVLLGMTGAQGIIATLGVAGVVCVATSSAGDISQDLKTGYLIGATPKKQQWMEIVGVIIPALVMAPVMIVLHHAYGIGTGNPGSLKAPQAALFASLVKGTFGEGTIPWNFVLIGAGVGVGILVVDEFLRVRNSTFRIPVMGVAVGMYLPLTLSVPVLLGGLVALSAKNNKEAGSGVLFSSGLIAGEAIMGVLIGTVIYFNKNLLPVSLFESNPLSLLALAALTATLAAVARK